MEVVLKPSCEHDESLERKSLRENNGKVKEDNGHQGRTMYLIYASLFIGARTYGNSLEPSFEACVNQSQIYIMGQIIYSSIVVRIWMLTCVVP